MYNHKLDTFMVVVDCGSFTKAAELLFISPTAVMKQMNTLEDELELTLIERNRSGVTPTPAGNLIYKDTLFLKEYSKKCLAAAKALEEQTDTTFCVGTSLLNPAKPFMDLWYGMNQKFSEYKLHLVSFDDNNETILSVIQKLGENFDFLIGVCDSRAWMSLCNFLPLGNYKKMVAVAKGHPLAKKDKVTLEDLYGETLMMVKAGDSGVNDFLRNDLEQHHPEIHIEDTPYFYDLSVFNECAESQKVLLSIECWQDVHPGLVTLPVEWEYTIPYGLLYSFDASKSVLEVVEEIKKAYV